MEVARAARAKNGKASISKEAILGWKEWLALPELGLPAIKAKVDTGGKTSSLHAAAIETYGPANRPKVRFLIHPNPDKPELEIKCTADVVDRRNVTSSNGETELRYVIKSIAQIGERRWPIELTLTNHETMLYRVLLGRTGITDDMIVDPNRSFAQPKLSFDLYNSIKAFHPVSRPLKIALLTREPKNYTSQRLLEAAKAPAMI